MARRRRLAAWLLGASGCFYGVNDVVPYPCEGGECNDGGLGDGCACAATPDGWSWIAFTAAQPLATCPNGTSAQDLVERADAAPPTCGCACGAVTVPASCTAGSVVVHAGPSSSCSTTTWTFPVDGGACQELSPPLNVAGGYFATLAPAPVVQGTCAGTGKAVDMPPVSSSGAARLCSVPGALLCDTGCAPSWPGFDLCIAHDGDAPCPPPYTKARVLGAVADSRGCGPCACVTRASCTAPSFHFHEDVQCSSTNDWYFSTGCTSFVPASPPNHTFVAYQYTASVSDAGSCLVSQDSSPTGGVAVTATRTLCCR
jgi:hypothetical protein